MRIFNFQKTKWKFLEEPLKEYTKYLYNPGCGWYQIYSFLAEELPDFDNLKTCINERERLALVKINIGSYRTERIDCQALLNIEQILSFFVEQKKDIVLRIVYDDEGKGLEHEPHTLDRIEQHMKELRPIFQKFSCHIYIIQGLFVGSWGEMHTSKFLSKEHMVRLYETLISMTDEKTFLAVRRPLFWRMLRDEKALQEITFSERLGLFDDGMLASENDLGTFGNVPRKKAAWEEAWLPKDEQDFENQLCGRVPHGGEALLGDYSNSLSAKETIELLKKMHVSYLNSYHDRRLINKWKQQKWNESTLYDYIGIHLGYRFIVRKAEVTDFKRKEYVNFSVQIENTGFSNCYEEGITYIEINTLKGQNMSFETKWDMRNWEAGKITKLSTVIPLVEGDVYMRTVRKKDQTAIFFAQEQPDDRVYLGKLQLCEKRIKE